MQDAYEDGLKALDEKDGLTAAKKFSEAELLFLNQSGHQDLL